MDAIKNIQYYIEKTMLEDEDFYSAVILYLNGEKDDYSAQTVLWELSHSNENGMFLLGSILGNSRQHWIY